MPIAAFVAAGLAAIVGTAALYHAWRRRRDPHRRWLALGWSGVLAALVAGGVAAGDGGVTIAALMVMAGACVWLGRQGFRAARPGAARPGAARGAQSAAAAVSGSARGLAAGTRDTVLAGPVAGFATLVASAAIYRLFSTANAGSADAIVGGLFAWPLLWAALAAAVTLTPKTLHQMAWIGGAGGLGAVLVVVTG